MVIQQKHLFEECELYLIEAYHHKSNLASGRVMEKAGMTKETSLRTRALNRQTGKLEDLIVYSITKDEYNQKNL